KFALHRVLIIKRIAANIFFISREFSKNPLIEPRSRANEGLLRVSYGCMRHARNPPTSVQEKPMTTDTRPFGEINAIAKQIKEQALVATDDYFKFLKKTISSHPARGSEVGDVLKSNAQRNIEL